MALHLRRTDKAPAPDDYGYLAKLPVDLLKRNPLEIEEKVTEFSTDKPARPRFLSCGFPVGRRTNVEAGTEGRGIAGMESYFLKVTKINHWLVSYRIQSCKVTIKWLYSSLQSLSSTVSSIESLGAPSTLKLPLWDKASAEFCFAKSRELLTKSSVWASYMNIDLNEHMLDNVATKQNLTNSTKFWENGNRRNHLKCEGVSDVDKKINVHHQHDKKFNMEDLKYGFSREMKRVSTSYVERFEQPKYCNDETTLECTCANSERIYFREKKLDKYVKINSLEQPKLTYSSNIQEQNLSVSVKSNQALQNKLNNCGLNDCNIMPFESRYDENVDILKEKMTNFVSPCNKPDKFDVARDKTNLDLDIRPKISDTTKVNITNFTKKINMSKSRAAKMSFMPRKSNQDMNTVFGLSDNIKTNMKTSGSDSSRSNKEMIKINIQSFRKFEQNQNDHEGFPYIIFNNPIFITEIEKKESSIYSSSESLRANFQRLRRKSDAEANQVELNNSKKAHSLNLGFSKLTQNMVQLGKNITQNSKNLETALPKLLVSNIRNLDLSAPSQTSLQSLNIPIQKPKLLDLNIPLQNQSSINAKLNLIKKSNPPTSPTLHQHILESPKLYQDDPAKKELSKLDMLAEKFSDAAVYQYRTSLSESKKLSIKNKRRSFHPRNDSSDDSDSISHSEANIRSHLRYKRRHKKVPHSLRLNFKNRISFLNPDSVKGLSAVEHCGKSPPPSTSLLNSLSPPFSSKNNFLSWSENVPSSNLTFTKKNVSDESCIEEDIREYHWFDSRLKVLLGNSTLLARLHQQSMLIFATIALGHPKSAFEPFQRLQGSSRCVLSSDSSSLAYWNLRWTVLKPYILPQRHKQWISGIQRTELFPLLSARREGLR
ncbi:hypothetical protein G5I_08245 [Acromyrmex echinatior]|uniref:Uncharacterized protein n=1 Tax=Acromyrmex echinatior TaxID=103372 RepID=F4WQZ9_ACREC|nr:hypothetical protein G5I_08245 [Acromyrmex echinatior]